MTDCPSFNVSIATIEDVDTILELESLSLPHPWIRSDIEALIYDDNKMALIIGSYGYVGVSWVLDEAEIGNICVHPDMRRHGFARALLTILISELQKRGIAQLFLEVDEENTGAISLYEKIGFECYSRRRGYYGKTDALLYRYVF